MSAKDNLRELYKKAKDYVEVYECGLNTEVKEVIFTQDVLSFLDPVLSSAELVAVEDGYVTSDEQMYQIYYKGCLTFLNNCSELFESQENKE